MKKFIIIIVLISIGTMLLDAYWGGKNPFGAFKAGGSGKSSGGASGSFAARKLEAVT